MCHASVLPWGSPCFSLAVSSSACRWTGSSSEASRNLIRSGKCGPRQPSPPAHQELLDQLVERASRIGTVGDRPRRLPVVADLPGLGHHAFWRVALAEHLGDQALPEVVVAHVVTRLDRVGIHGPSPYPLAYEQGILPMLAASGASSAPKEEDRDDHRPLGRSADAKRVTQADRAAGAGRGNRAFRLRRWAGLRGCAPSGSGRVAASLRRRPRPRYGPELRRARGHATGLALPNGVVAPSFYEPAGEGWLRLFPGGPLVTCGLRNVGPPRAKAKNTASTVALPIYRVQGLLRRVLGRCRLRSRSQRGDQGGVFGPNLVLRRRISARVGEPRLWIEDEIENEDSSRSP